MENSINAWPGAQKTTKFFERVMRKGGKGSEKQYANFSSGIPTGSLTRFGAVPPGSD
jgi:hypothetical protein